MRKVNRDRASAFVFALAVAAIDSFCFQPRLNAQVQNPGIPYVGSPASNNDCAKFVVTGGNLAGITTYGGQCPSGSPGGVTGNVQTNNGTGGFNGINNTQLTALINVGSATQEGILQVDGSGICATNGIISLCTPYPAVPVAGNPTATGTGAAINGTAATFMRSDAAFAIQNATAGRKGLVQVDGTGICISLGIISLCSPYPTVPVSANPTAKVGPTVVNGSASTWMKSDAAPPIDETASYIWSGQHTFQQGSFWCDPGGGGGVADEHTAINSCIATLVSLGGGTVKLTSGVHCDFAGTSMTNYPANVAISFEGTSGGSYSNCQHDVVTLELNGTYQQVRNLSIAGYNSPSATQPAFKIGPACIQCATYNVQLFFGAGGMQQFGEATHYDLSVSDTFADLIYTEGGTYMYRPRLDNIPDTPVSGCSYPVRTGSIPAWSAGETVTKCELNLITSGGIPWLIMAATNGTAGGSSPAPATFGTSIADGTATWQLLSRSGANGNCVNINNATSVLIDGADITTPCVWNVFIQGTSSIVTINKSTIAYGVNGNIQLKGGYDVKIDGNLQIGNCIPANCTGIEQTTSFTGDTSITNNTIFNVTFGYLIDGSGPGTTQQNAIFTGNIVGGTSDGFISNSGALGFTVNNNGFGTAEWGANSAKDISIGASNDYFSVVGNRCNGVGGGLTNGSSGASHMYVPSGGNPGC